MALEAPPLEFYGDVNEWIRKIALTLREMIQGENNFTGEVTLTESTTSTTVTDSNCTSKSTVVITPLTSSASIAMAAGYYIEPGMGSFTIQHASDAATDQDFRYAVFG